MLVSIRGIDAPDLKASLGRHLVRHPHFVLKIVDSRGVLSDDRVLSGLPIPMSVPGWPMVTMVFHGHGLVRADGRGAEIVPRHVVWTPPGMDYRARTDGTRAMLLQWDPEVFGGLGPTGPDRLRVASADFFRVREAVAATVSAGRDTTRAATAVVALFEVLRAQGLVSTRPDVGDLARPVDPIVVRAGVAIDVALSTPGMTPGSVDIERYLARSPAQTRRIVRQYADALRMHGASSWRDMLHVWRAFVGAALMTAGRATTEGVAHLLGYGSPVAFCHAFAQAGLPSPGRLGAFVRQLA
jgi:hypothetical protein